jgi:hypothetical protein
MRRGDAIAPFLFKVVLEITIRKPRVEIWGTIFDKCFQIMAYVDMMVKCEVDYKKLDKYLHHWSENK